jgi:hypothetical protein
MFGVSEINREIETEICKTVVRNNFEDLEYCTYVD